MYLTPFVSIFGEQGGKETRVLTTSGYPGLPDDEYALVEAYCTDPACDCRRVMLNVVGHRQGDASLASISFGFERDAEMAGPYLDPLNLQTRYADVLFPLVAQVLADPAYVARLESHYRQIKRAAADPHDPAYKMIRRLHRDEQRWTASQSPMAASGATPAREIGRTSHQGRGWAGAGPRNKRRKRK